MARKKHDIHYIYKTTCNVTGKYYVGMHSTSNLEDGYLGSGLRLRRSIRKYGKENHTKEILEFCETRELLIEAEIKTITPDMVLDKNCMNLKQGGCGGFSNDEQMMNCSKAGNKALQFKLTNDVTFKEIYLEKISKSLKVSYGIGKREKYYFYNWSNQNHSEETKKLMSEKKQGKGISEMNSQFGTCWITKDGINKKIKKENLETYLELGWVKGRKICYD